MPAPPRSYVLRLTLIAATALTAIVGAAWLGYMPVNWNEVRHPFTDQGVINVFWQIRVPRTLLGACAGAGLALGGVILQTLFRNPLATPYTLGIASGAALAAAIGFILNLGGYWLGMPALSVLAFGGALCAMGLVYLMAKLRSEHDMTRLLLAGVCLAYLGSAGVLLVTVLAGAAVTNDIVMWMIGALGTHRPDAVLEIFVILVTALAALLYCHRALDLLMVGDDWAATRGVNVRKVVWTCFVLVGLLTAVIVANCGPIGFVGLMVPHITRALVGSRTLPLIIGSTLIGAAFLALCDGLARSFSTYEIPVGVVTNILGAAFFFYLLAARDVAPAGGK